MFTDPLKNLKALGLREDNIVADLGAGTGFYSVLAGGLVPRGKVYAVEIAQDFWDTIKDKVQEARLDNVEILSGDVEIPFGTKIADKVVDVVVASNVLFQIRDKERFIEEMKRILKHKGRTLLVDWSESEVMGAKKIFPKVSARALFEKKGFVFEREIDAGPRHYGMIFGLGSRG